MNIKESTNSASDGINGGTGCNFTFFHIAIGSFNKVTSKIQVQLGDNQEVNTSSKEIPRCTLVGNFSGSRKFSAI